MIKMGTFNASGKFKSQISSNKQDTAFEVPCLVNKALIYQCVELDLKKLQLLHFEF